MKLKSMGPDLQSKEDEQSFSTTTYSCNSKGKRKASNFMNLNPDSHHSNKSKHFFGGYEEILQNRDAGMLNMCV